MAECERSALCMVPSETLHNRYSVYADRKRPKNMASFSVTKGKRVGLFAGAANHLPCKLREEFANKGFELYQNIYRDICESRQ